MYSYNHHDHQDDGNDHDSVGDDDDNSGYYDGMAW